MKPLNVLLTILLATAAPHLSASDSGSAAAAGGAGSDATQSGRPSLSLTRPTPSCDSDDEDSLAPAICALKSDITWSTSDSGSAAAASGAGSDATQSGRPSHSFRSAAAATCATPASQSRETAFSLKTKYFQRLNEAYDRHNKAGSPTAGLSRAIARQLLPFYEKIDNVTVRKGIAKFNLSPLERAQLWVDGTFPKLAYGADDASAEAASVGAPAPAKKSHRVTFSQENTYVEPVFDTSRGPRGRPNTSGETRDARYEDSDSLGATASALGAAFSEQDYDDEDDTGTLAAALSGRPY